MKERIALIRAYCKCFDDVKMKVTSDGTIAINGRRFLNTNQLDGLSTAQIMQLTMTFVYCHYGVK